jgi:hypothetical protein
MISGILHGEEEESTAPKRFMKVYQSFLRPLVLSSGSGNHVAYPNRNFLLAATSG